MTSYRSPSSASKLGPQPVQPGPLRAIQRIHTVGNVEPFEIVPIVQALGSVMTPEEHMAAQVRWAERAQYTILTRNVPASFAPYNAVIRVSERGTEDVDRDYLAHLVYEQETAP